MYNLPQFEPTCIDEFATTEQEIIKKRQKMMLNDYIVQFNLKQEEIIKDFMNTNWFCQTCFVKIYAHSTKVIKVLTKAEEVTLKLKRYRCSECKIMFTPAQKLIPPNFVSANLCEVICTIATKTSFENTKVILKSCLNIYVPTKVLHRILNKESENMVDIIAKDSEKVFQNQMIEQKVHQDKTTMIIGLDGGY